MCGIAGIINEESNETSVDALKKMLISQHHRGPNYTGVFSDNHAFLGHNRLSIIDLSSQANQPFTSNDNRYIVVFNGEIYNYLELKKELSANYNFITNSDTEVLLAAYIKWGSKCLSKLTGMFAFAIWDKEQKILFAARDRFGVKPFHYFINKNSLVFSSEIKAIWASGMVPKEMDSVAWASYLAFGTYASIDNTFWKDIKQLPGGCFLTYQNKKLEITRWYEFKQRVDEVYVPENFDQAKDLLEEKLLKSIKYRLHADVNVGFNLSGGIDSTLLFLLIKKHLDIRLTSAFTFYSGDDRYDEIEWVKQIIGNTKFNWEKVKVNSDEIPVLAKFMQEKQDEPYAGIASLAYAKVFEAARKSGYIVLLDGGGMDEQIVGYDYYTNQSNSLIQGVKSSPVKINCIDNDFLKNALSPTFPEPFNDKIKNLQYRDLFYTKLPRDLRFNDRMSMAYSTELREPFLDHELVEYSFSLPLEWKIKDGQKKWILRKIIKNFATENIVEAPKRPIQTPQREWLSVDLKDWVFDQINLGINNFGFLDKTKTLQELDSYLKGNNENSFFIWQWITLGLIS